MATLLDHSATTRRPGPPGLVRGAVAPASAGQVGAPADGRGAARALVPARSVPGRRPDRHRGAARRRPATNRTRPATRPATALRLTARGRAVTGLLAVALLTGGGLLGPGRATEAGPHGQRAERVVVQSGDTLWSIAVRVAPEADPRQTVARIAAANQLAGATLRPGQTLTVSR